MSVAIVRDPAYHRHSNGSGHPERAERLEALDRMVEGAAFRRQLEDLPARDALVEEILWVHTREHIDRIEATRSRPFTALDEDTAACEASCSAAIRAVGGALAATEAVLAGRHAASFAFVRPPGHHAEADRAMGYCLFNNVAIAAEYARRVHRLDRIAIVDWDVHHGNGTMHTFYETPAVLYASLHQYPHYPGTGSAREIGFAEGEGYTVNIPLPGQQHDGDYLLAFERVLLPVLRAYRPQLFLISAGFDAHVLDPLADMDLSSACFGRMTRAIQEVAQGCSAPIALVLEGGYAVGALVEGVASVLDALVQDRAPPAEWRAANHRPSATVSRVLDRVTAALAPRWPVLREAC